MWKYWLFMKVIIMSCKSVATRTLFHITLSICNCFLHFILSWNSVRGENYINANIQMILCHWGNSLSYIHSSRSIITKMHQISWTFNHKLKRKNIYISLKNVLQVSIVTSHCDIFIGWEPIHVVYVFLCPFSFGHCVVYPSSIGN